MFLTEVIPLTKIPRRRTEPFFYFTSQKLKRGFLVSILLRKKEVLAIVISQRSIRETKLELKMADYQLKPIKEVLICQEIIGFPFLDLVQWISGYYFSSLSNSLLLFLPQKIVKKIVFERDLRFPRIKPKDTKKSFLSPKVFISKIGFLPKKEIKSVLEQGKQILFLFPRRSQKAFWEEKLKKISPSLIFWSSKTSPKNFFNNFQKVKNKEVQIIFGQISALFAPFCDLGLIVIFDPENSSFKAKKEPRFNVKDVACKMAQILKIDLLQVDSFLSLENYYLKLKKKIKIIKLQNENFFLNFSNLKFIERGREEGFSPISKKLFDKIQSYLFRDKKIILFLNRRGVATSLFCQDCGFIMKCKNCNLPLTYHLGVGRAYLLCHHCGQEGGVPSYCPYCNSWRMKTIGIGTQKVEDFLKEKFKKENIDVPILKLDKDSTKTKTKQKEVINLFLSAKRTILITTKLIFNFPESKSHLVGIISLESLLSLPSFKIKEEILRIIHNLAGVAKEEFLLQVFSRGNDFYRILKENQFYPQKIFDILLQERQFYFYPPYASLIKLTLLDKNLRRAIENGEKLKNEIRKMRNFLNIPPESFKILGPAPAFVAKKNKNFVFHILIKENLADFHKRNKILKVLPPSWEIDIDPLQTI